MQFRHCAGQYTLGALADADYELVAELHDLKPDVAAGGFRARCAMVRAGVSQIVFSSSCAVYGQPDSVPIVEGTRCNPINPYGFAKFACEGMMDDFGHAYGVRSVALRYFNAAGAEETDEIGEDYSPEPHLIPLVLEAASGVRSNIQVFGTDYETPDGTAVRDYVHVSDLARAHVLAVQYLLAGGGSIALNLARGWGASVREVVDAASAVTGCKIDARDAHRRSGDPAILVADATLAQDLLGWSAKRWDLATVISDAWQWHLRRFGRRELVGVAGVAAFSK
jgi:UDP-glucose 4-epimerase